MRGGGKGVRNIRLKLTILNKFLSFRKSFNIVSNPTANFSG